jgi:hypothetical protein
VTDEEQLTRIIEEMPKVLEQLRAIRDQLRAENLRLGARIAELKALGEKNMKLKLLIIAAVLLLASTVNAQLLQTVKFSITWVDNSTNEQGFHLEQCVGQGCTSFYRIGGDIPANQTNYQDTILNDPGNRMICYRVKAFNLTGESGPSNTACATTPPVNVVPSQPTGLTVQPVSTQTPPPQP